MNAFWEELTLGLPDLNVALHMAIRISAAIVLGAALGLQRERAGKPAGIKTHTLATLGTALFVMACGGYGMGPDALSRVIQGIVTGIGFLGAGAILKTEANGGVKGLTTAAMIWVSAAIGVACGLGAVGFAIIVTVLVITVITLMSRTERKYFPSTPDDR